jgi:hypothetical protein
MTGTPLPRRRDMLRLAAGAASLALLPGTPASATTVTLPKSPARVAFLSPEDGAAAFGRPGDTYYADMGLLEIRARMRSPLAGLALADARKAVHDDDVAAVLPFTEREKTAIRGVIDRMQSSLEIVAPLYARTPWSFIKLDDRAEGGMPHTRGPHIVLPRETVDHFVVMHQELLESGRLAVSPRGRNLLLHEQTHVLERVNPALFEPLFTDVFGFTRMTPAPTTPWLDAHVVVNPDGPDLAWAFALEQVGGSGWVMPYLTVPDKAVPRMPADFQAIGVEVAKTADGWKVVERDGVPVRRDLDAIPGYHAHFPFPDEDFHPNEIAAVVLAHLLVHDVPDLEGRPLMAGVRGWGRHALR